MDIGKRIKYFRQKKKLSLRDLEKLTELRYTTISNIERGLTNDPGISIIVKLSKAFNITIDEFIEEKED